MVVKRTGISLIEVMISIAIVATSLLALLTLLPVAGQQAERALTQDRAAIVGRNATSQFNARRLADADQDVVTTGNILAKNLCVGSSASPLVLAPATTYFIDPMFVARYGDTGFPDVIGVTQCRRLNARAAEIPDNVFVQWNALGVPAFVSLTTPPGIVPGAMSSQMADYVFTSQDDLVFERNEEFKNTVDPTAPLMPIQQLGGSLNLRESEGKFSWAAMIQPTSNQPGSYQLSIIVFENRDLQRGSDRVAQITPGDFFSNGLGGGDIQISTRPGQPNSDVAIRKGQWVCLAPSTNVNWFQWYRVIDAEFAEDNQPVRNITLDGADWPTSPAWVPPALASGFQTPYVIIPSGVVAVYSRTIRFGTSGLSD